MARKTHSPAKAAQAGVVVMPLLTVEDVANILQLSKAKIYEHIQKNGLPTVKISGARRIQPAALQAWIEQHQQ